MQLVNEENLPTSLDLVDAKSPLEGDSSMRFTRSISLGTVASLLLHLVAVLALTFVVGHDYFSGDIDTLPTFSVTLTTSLDADGDATPENTVSSSESFTTEDVPLKKPVEEILIRQPAGTGLTVEPSLPDTAKVVEVTQETAQMREETSERHEPVDEVVASTASVLTTPTRSTFVVNNVEPVDDMAPIKNRAPGQRLTDSQAETFEEQIKEWRNDLFEKIEEIDQMTFEENGQVYSASFEKVPAQAATDFDYVDITVTTRREGRTLETSMQMRRMAFSDFGQIIDRWDENVALFNDEIEGRFHSNSTIQIDSNRTTKPVFHDRVTTSRVTRLGSHARRNDIFLGGLETRVRRVELPKEVLPFNPNDDRKVSPDQVHFIEGDANIIFHGDGEYSFGPVDSSQNAERRTISGDAYYIIGSDGSMLSVSGVVKGCVVVYSPDVVSIAGDLHYAHDPEVYPESGDYLGLISARYVEVASPDITGPGDLTIYAAIYAKRRFSVKRFRNRNRGLLTIYGSLAAGSLSASEPRYATRISYDDRFHGVRPPGYPLTEQYELEEWDRTWREVN